MSDYPQNLKVNTHLYYDAWNPVPRGIDQRSTYPFRSRHNVAYPYPSKRITRANSTELSEKERLSCKKRRKVLGDVFDRFADVTSLQGISFFNKARRPAAKTIWVIIFITALVMSALHAMFVCSSYLKFDTTTHVNIIHQEIEFPSITFCNLNPVQSNKIKALESKLPLWNSLLNQLKPRLDYKLNLDGPSVLNGRRNVQKSAINSSSNKAHLQKYDKLNISILLNQLEIHDSVELLTDDMVAPDIKVSTLLKEIVAKTNRDVLNKITHSLEDMLLDCSYGGTICDQSNFTTSFHNEYGKCWTFNSYELKKQSLKAKRSGTLYGLGLTLYIQGHNYINGLSQGRGIRLDIHKHNTLPFVAANGISVAPGLNTYVGMRIVNKTNLGGIYGACDDTTGAFEKYYNGTDYTLTGCINTCLDRTISKTCGCYRETYSEYYNEYDRKNLPKCQSQNIACTSKQRELIDQGNHDCGCNQACNMVDYRLEISSNVWPDENVWWLFVDTICADNMDDCYYLRNVSVSQRLQVLRSNFLQMDIYFKDLNIEYINEIQAYDISQFVSDLGGAIGLWLGASVLTVVELIDLIIQLFNYCTRRNIYKKREDETCSNVSTSQKEFHTKQSGMPNIISKIR